MRGNGEGSVYQRSSDGLWVGAVTLPTGKRKPVYGRTQREAREKMRDVQRAVDDGRPITSGRGVTLARYLDQWTGVTLPSRVAAGRMAQSTLDSYRDNVEKHVTPSLGAEQLAKLTPARVRQWLTELSVKPSGRARKTLRPGETELPPPPPLSSRTVAYCHAILRKALADAVRDELVPRNVASLVEPPVVKRKPLTPPSKTEVAALLAAASGDRLAALWLVILALGLRRGEALGLRWSNVDLDAGTVRLEKGVQRQRGDIDPATGKRRGKLVEADLKTAASHATMALPARAVLALTEHRRRQLAERLRAPVWADADLVFTTTIGTAIEPRNANRAWEAVCAAAGVRRYRVHDLRHACATYLFAEGLDLKVVQATLRHTRLSTTSDVYVHVLEDVQRGAADRMDDVLGAVSPVATSTATRSGPRT